MLIAMIGITLKTEIKLFQTSEQRLKLSENYHEVSCIFLSIQII